MKGVDHLIYGVPDLGSAVDQLEKTLGVRPGIGGRHPDLGTWNALLALAPRAYLEVMAPDPEGSGGSRGRPFGLDDLDRPRLVAWCARHPDLESAVREARDLDVELGQPTPGSRDRPDGRTLTWRITDPYADRLDGVVPFLIDWGDTPHPAGSAPAGVRLRDLTLNHPRPERVRRVLEALGLEVAVEGGPASGLEAVLESPEGEVVLT